MNKLLLKKNLELRAKIIQAIRNFFVKNGFLETETPCRIPAPAPETNIDAFSSGSWFLQTSPELCMKRLIASGYSKIFQICKCFRMNERGSRHLTEFTMLEWYFTCKNYFDMMGQCEELIKFIAINTGSGSFIKYQGKKIDLENPWKKITVENAFKKFASVSMGDAILSNRFDEIMALEIEPALGFEKPVFLYDYPAQAGSLARLKQENSQFVERFELYICGIELCNAFGELTDPVEQKKRFEKERQDRKLAGKKAYPMPKKFLDALKYMPKTSGNAMGIDRLVMLFTDSAQIDDVICFTPEEL